MCVCEASVEGGFDTISPKFPSRKRGKHVADQNTDLQKSISRAETQLEEEEQRLYKLAYNFTTQQTKEELMCLHTHMDLALGEVEDQLGILLRQQRTEEFMQVYSRAVEKATIDYAKLEGQEAKQL